MFLNSEHLHTLPYIACRDRTCIWPMPHVRGYSIHMASAIRSLTTCIVHVVILSNVPVGDQSTGIFFYCNCCRSLPTVTSISEYTCTSDHLCKLQRFLHRWAGVVSVPAQANFCSLSATSSLKLMTYINILLGYYLISSIELYHYFLDQ